MVSVKNKKKAKSPSKKTIGLKTKERANEKTSIAPHFDTQESSVEPDPNVEISPSSIPDSFQTDSRPRR